MSSTQTPRAASACISCRKRKVKCSGDQPCQSCRRHNWDCNFGTPTRSRYNDSYVQSLLAKIKSYEQHAREQPQSVDHGPSGHDNAISPQAQTSPIRSHPAQIDQDISESPATDRASGPEFETQARTLLHTHHSHRTSPSYTRNDYNLHETPASSQLIDGDLNQTAKELIENVSPAPMPTLTESQQSLDTFLSFLGVTQHFFDPRVFTDSMILLFRNPKLRDRQKNSFWYSEYLLVIAMAKLITGDNNPLPDRPPGIAYFAEAMTRLPPVSSLRDIGVEAVEVLALATLYLSWCDKPYEGYFYIGISLRLAISLGCSKPWREQDCLPSEALHRTRLWWTVYMLDRRLSAGLGLPVGSDDRQMIIDLPHHAAGFQSPEPLILNVKIARETSNIISSLYGNSTMSQMDFIQKVQAILQSLYDIGRAFPHEYILDFTKPVLNVSRTAASLHLMLFQAIILCVRPIVLQRVRQIVSTDDETNNHTRTQEPSPVVARLCQTCNEAAVKSLAILSELQQKNMIPRFGYFDLDATFSAAFILVMIGAAENSETTQGIPNEIDKACEVLRYLAKAGNNAAARRLKDIRQFCSHVWSVDLGISPESSSTTNAAVGLAMLRSPPLGPRSQQATQSSVLGSFPITSQQTGSSSLNPLTGRDSNTIWHLPTTSSPTTTFQNRGFESAPPSPHHTSNINLSNMNRSQLQPPTNPSRFTPQTSTSNTVSGTNTFNSLFAFPLTLAQPTFDNLNNDFLTDFNLAPEDISGIVSSFNDPSLPLTGVDYTDWLEMEKLWR